jgi:hypothetical protein
MYICMYMCACVSVCMYVCIYTHIFTLILEDLSSCYAIVPPGRKSSFRAGFRPDSNPGNQAGGWGAAAPWGGKPIHMCMYVYTYVGVWACMYISTYACMYVCMYV